MGADRVKAITGWLSVKGIRVKGFIVFGLRVYYIRLRVKGFRV